MLPIVLIMVRIHIRDNAGKGGQRGAKYPILTFRADPGDGQWKKKKKNRFEAMSPMIAMANRWGARWSGQWGAKGGNNSRELFRKSELWGARGGDSRRWRAIYKPMIPIIRPMGRPMIANLRAMTAKTRHAGQWQAMYSATVGMIAIILAMVGDGNNFFCRNFGAMVL